MFAIILEDSTFCVYVKIMDDFKFVIRREMMMLEGTLRCHAKRPTYVVNQEGFDAMCAAGKIVPNEDGWRFA